MKKKVLFFIPKGHGGAQKISILLAKILSRNGFDVKIVLVGKASEPDMSHLIPRTIPVDNLVIKNVWDFLSIRLYAIMKKNKVDVVFSSVMYLNVRVILAAIMYGKAKIVVRNDNMLCGIRKDWLFLLKILYPKADCVIAQQMEMKRELEKKIRFKKDIVIVLNNPVDLDDINRKSRECSPYVDYGMAKKYVWTGNFMQSGSKGQDVLLKAFDIVHKKNQYTHLFILGVYDENSNYFRTIKQYIRENELNDYVHIVGFKENPYPWVSNADCFVLPSRKEGLPNALIDATLLNVPVVATNCITAMKEIVDEARNGFIVNVNDVCAMAIAMEKAVELENCKPIYIIPSDDEIVNIFK